MARWNIPMIQTLKRPDAVDLTTHIDTILRIHGLRTVLVALARAVLHQRRAAAGAGLIGVPPTLRRDVGLPPEVPRIEEYRHRFYR